MHHHRKKSGLGSANTSFTDVRTAVTVSDLSYRQKPLRPAMARRTAPGTAHKLGKNARDRDRELDDEYWLSTEHERDSFPQFCMTCEKQFFPPNDRILYCSEACRAMDQNKAPVSVVPPYYHSYHSLGPRPRQNYPLYSADIPEPRDIVPRASPSRPTSLHMSPPTSPDSSHYTSAVSALRSLSLCEPSAVPAPGPYRNSNSIWPFSSRYPPPSPNTSSNTSYNTRPTSMYTSTYDSYGYALNPPRTTDGALPSRRPGTHSRTKSTDLVTPTSNSRYGEN